MNTMYIGSGDVKALLMKRDTAGHLALLQRFVSGVKPNYNALSSPIDAFRTGAILEGRFAEILPLDFYPQYRVISTEMNVFKCSLDFAELSGGNVIDFIELKTVNFSDFLVIEGLRNAELSEQLAYIKKFHKDYYNQIQQQMFCTRLDSAQMVFLAVYSYDDEENYTREIKPNEWVSIRVPRDEMTIAKILEAGTIFQTIKNYYTN